MKDTFKWGIIGPGRIARKFAEAVWGIPDADVYAVASRSATDPEQLVKTFRAKKYYASYEELVADADVDAVYIATPHRFHYENIRLCLDAEKAILCEKPITINANQADEVFTLSQLKGTFLMEALWTRFLPIYGHVRRWLDSGEVGDIRVVRSSFGFRAPLNLEDRHFNIQLAGGTILDIGIYNTALAQWAFQKSPRSVNAVGYIGKTGVDETVSAVLSYEDDAFSPFTCSFQVPLLNQIEISGPDGKIIVHADFWEATRATLIKDGKTRTAEKPMDINGFEYQIRASMKAIRGGACDCPQMTQSDTLANMETLDEIRRQVGMRYPFE